MVKKFVIQRISVPLLSLLLIFGLLGIATPSASAADDGVTTQVVPVNDSIQTTSELQSKLISDLKEANPVTEDEVDKAVSDFYSTHDVAVDSSSFEDSTLPVVDGGEGTSQDNPINVEQYIDENVDNGGFAENKINDNISIIFTNSPVYFIDTTEEEETLPSEVLSDGVLSDNDTTASSNVVISPLYSSRNTKTYTHTYTARSWIGLTLFKLSVKGYFSYTGSSVKPHLNNAWTTRGMLSIWQSSNWEKGTYTKGSNYAEVYGRGNFHYGFEIRGVGLVVQDKYFKVYLSSNNDGHVSKHTSIY